MIKISGIIENVRYNSGKGFAVLDITDADGDHQVLAGKIYDPQPGMRIDAEGEFVNHSVYGTQFSVFNSHLQVAKTKSAIIRYLASGLFSGVGLTLAHAIVQKFGVDVVTDIIEKDYMRLTEIPKISSRLAERIHRQHAENFV